MINQTVQNTITYSNSDVLIATLFGLCLYIGHLIIESANSSDAVATISDIQTVNTTVQLTESQLASLYSILLNSTNVNIGTATEAIEALRRNLNFLHYIVIHGKEQVMYLVTIASDTTISVHASAVVDASTTAEQLNSIKQSFMNVAIGSGMPIKVTIITLVCANFFSVIEPFMPLLDILVCTNWDLAGYVQDFNELYISINDVYNNLALLTGFIDYLTERCEELFNSALFVGTDTLGENIWNEVKAGTQLIRHMEVIHRIYSPIQSVDEDFSNIMEEE